ncbi:MAG: carboxypeptidase regulatory-like domain-containing protein [Acidobacteriaceae bacterium]|nr:carboxypeptidase regulatory-like domain-containing protein [Acidobacteriaceae bacterium]
MPRYLALFTCLFLPAAAAAQSVTGSITGSVSDISGAPVSDAAVKLTSEATAATRSATTDERGSFTFSAVSPGVYSITVDRPGFKTFEKTHIELTPATISPSAMSSSKSGLKRPWSKSPPRGPMSRPRVASAPALLPARRSSNSLA